MPHILRLTPWLIAGSVFSQTPAPDLQSLVRDSLAFMQPGRNKSTEYSCSVRSHRKQFDAAGNVTSDSLTLSRRTFEDGFPVTRIIEKNGRKLSDREHAEQEEKISRQIEELKSRSPHEKEEDRKKSAENDAWLSEVPGALAYSPVGEETIDNRRVIVLDFVPRPGYVARSARAKLLEKIKGRFWIDKVDRELVRAEAETFDSINIGMGIFGRVDKGTRFSLHRTRLPDNNWVTDVQTVRFGARIMLVKWISNEIETRMSDFRHKSSVALAR